MANTPYQAERLYPGFWAIEEKGVRCFLVEGGGRAMLVDTGFGTGDLKAFTTTLTQAPVFVVNTHADGDHIGCNHQFGHAWMHPAEYDRYAQRQPDHGVRLSPLWEGDHIDLGPWHFEVLLIPGHTPGSIALLERDHGLLIAGDTVQAGTIYLFCPGRNLPAFRCSLEKLAGYADQIRRVLPSHGPLPLTADCIEKLEQAAQQLAEGKLAAMPPDRDLPCQLYDGGVARFYY